MLTRLTKSSRAKESRTKVAMKRLLCDLADMDDDGVSRFRKKWDSLYRKYTDQELLTLRDELRLLWGGLNVDVREEDPQPRLQSKERVERLLRVWGNFPGTPLEQLICEHWLRDEKRWVVVEWTSKSRSIKASRHCLPAILAFGCVIHGTRLQVCRNAECPAPYYLASRSDQKFCTSKCASPSKQAAKRKWWRERRGRKQVRQAAGAAVCVFSLAIFVTVPYSIALSRLRRPFLNDRCFSVAVRRPRR